MNKHWNILTSMLVVLMLARKLRYGVGIISHKDDFDELKIKPPMNNRSLSRDVDSVKRDVDSVIDRLVSEIEDLEVEKDELSDRVRFLEREIDDLTEQLIDAKANNE